MEFACSHCGTRLQVRDELAGRTGKCVHCGQKMTVPHLAESTASAASARTDHVEGHETQGPPSGSPLRLHGLNPTTYEHPLDKKALDALQRTPGLGRLVGTLNELTIERAIRIQYTGSNLRVCESCLPEVHRELAEVCENIHLPRLPQLYVECEDKVTAFTSGVRDTIVVISAGCIDRLSRAERRFVIGHEVGHIKSEHVLYHQMGQLLPVLGDMLGTATLGVGELLSKPMELALYHWCRMSEFTADRAGLLACQDVNAAVTTFMKIAGLPETFADTAAAQSFIAQASEFETFNYDTLDRAAKLIFMAEQTHPWTVMRGAELLKWIDSGEYHSVLRQFSDEVQAEVPAADVRFCPECGLDRQPEHAFCSDCGHRFV